MSDLKEKKEAKAQEAKREIVRKVLQYGMLAVLLGIAFILPAYGVNRYARENSEKRGARQELEGQGISEQNMNSQSREGQNTGEQSMDGQKGPEPGEEMTGPSFEEKEDTEAVKGTIVIDAGHGGAYKCNFMPCSQAWM